MVISDKMSVAILCGGKSRRMGTDKAALPAVSGDGDTIIGHLIRSFSSIEDLWLSIGNGESYPHIPVRKISDRYRNSGPMGGLESLLTVCRHDLLFVTAVDIPYADEELATELFSYMKDDIDAVLVIDGKNRKQPLLGIYRKRVLQKLRFFLKKGLKEKSGAGINSPEKETLKNRNFRMKDFLETIRVRYIPAESLSDGIRKTKSFNNQEEYDQIIGYSDAFLTEPSIPVLSVTGWSGSGKTTFLEQLVPRLKEQGIRIAYLKHDAHHFEIDREGKDSYRITRAGADMTGLISAEKSVWMENRPVTFQQMLQSIHDVDLILLEGGSNTIYPKLLVYRESLGKGMRADPASCLAVISDDPVSGAICQFGFQEVEKVSAFLCNWITKTRKNS